MGAGVCPENATVRPRPKRHGCESCVIVNLKSKYLPWTWTPHSCYVLLFISYLSHMPVRKCPVQIIQLYLHLRPGHKTRILAKKTKCDYSVQQGWGLFYAVVLLLSPDITKNTETTWIWFFFFSDLLHYTVYILLLLLEHMQCTPSKASVISEEIVPLLESFSRTRHYNRES